MSRSLSFLIAGPTLAVALITPTHASADAPTAGARAPARAPILGGTEAPVGAWPDIVAIYERDPGDGTILRSCTGTLIAPRLVLTAAHCIEDFEGTKYDLTHVLVGATIAPCSDAAEDPCGDAEANGEQIAIVRTEAHPGGELDIGLVFLASDSTMEPRIIGSGEVALKIVADATVGVVGWGALDADASEYVPELQQAFTKITDATCSSDPRGCVPELRPAGEFIAGEATIDTCPGDSGGPVYLEVGDESYVIGVTSRGFADSPLGVYCGGGGIYVRADANLAWIETTAGITLPQPDISDDGDGGGCCQSGGGAAGALPALAVGLALLLPRRRRLR